MILKNNPQEGLQSHQLAAYNNVLEKYKTGNKAAVVIPTGCGKSFISLQLMVDNQNSNIMLIAPSNAIKSQMYNYIAKYIVGKNVSKEEPAKKIAEEYFPNMKIITYQSLLRMDEEVMKKLNLDVLILDELHRTGAEKWGDKIDKLLDYNSNTKLLGVTATPDRMDNSNVIDNMFDGEIAYELTLIDALKSGIVNQPKYVKCDYSLGEEVEKIELAIQNSDDEYEKKQLKKIYTEMKKIVQKADGIQTLFEKNLNSPDGKYIVFARNKEHMDELMKKSDEWFSNINTNIEKYSVYSGAGYNSKKNSKMIKEFEKSKSPALKLLFSVDMLNEGLHVEDISGVLMMRKTDSRIIYLQQLGRVLSSDTSREIPIVFDLVNNYLNINLDKEINEKELKDDNDEETKINNGQFSSDSIKDPTEKQEIDIFKITGETKRFLELFAEANEIQSSNIIQECRKLQNWRIKNTTLKLPRKTSKDNEEKECANIYIKLKEKLSQEYYILENESEKELYIQDNPHMEEILAVITDIDSNNIPSILTNIRKIQNWVSINNVIPRNNSLNNIERNLANSLSHIRGVLKKEFYILENEESKKTYLHKNPYMKEVVEVIAELENNYLHPRLADAREIEAWMISNNTNIPPSQSKNVSQEEKDLSKKYNILMTKRNQYDNLNSQEKKDNYLRSNPYMRELLEITDRIKEKLPKAKDPAVLRYTPKIPRTLKNAQKIENWMKDNKTTKPPSESSHEKEEKKLAKSLDTIKTKIKNEYTNLDPEKKEAYLINNPHMSTVLKIVTNINENNIKTTLRNARNIETWMLENKTTKTPSKNSKDPLEKQLGSQLGSIRKVIKKNISNSESPEALSQYLEKNPHMPEVIQIINNIDSKFENLKALTQTFEDKKSILNDLKNQEKILRNKKEKNNNKGILVDDE